MFFRFSRYIVHWYIAPVSVLSVSLPRSPYVSHSHVVYNADRAATAHGQLGTM